MTGTVSLVVDQGTSIQPIDTLILAAGHSLAGVTVTLTSDRLISGVETTHPDKGTEMFLYELGVAEEHRRQGIGRALVVALADLARGRGCYGMWVGVDVDNDAAQATYLAGGADEGEDFVLQSWSFR